jgi:O-succinylbenzoate synthase
MSATKLSWCKRTLLFRQPAGTSRGVMKTRDVWYLFSGDKVGECAPLPGLSIDNLSEIENKLDEVCVNQDCDLSGFPSIKFALEMLQQERASFEDIPINGLIWMGKPEFMLNQINQKISEDWSCIKMKIGAVDFEDELNLLRTIGDNFELRVDANGAFNELDVNEKLNRLSKFNLHSIEQPIKSGQWDLLAQLCENSPIPIALDEELIPLVEEADRIEMLDKVKPQYLVLKPSLLGGFAESEKWIALAEERNIGWWVTSALESNIGLNAIAQWVSKLDTVGYQGLGTGKLFINNVPFPMVVKSGLLNKDSSTIWSDVEKFIAQWISPEPTINLQTSGSTGTPKTITVQKEWMRNSAKMTGKEFNLQSDDSALLCMPMQYIAAKMMVVRAIELGLELKVEEPSSQVKTESNFVSMVPLQLENSLDNLNKYKTVLVGGGQVSSQLIEKLQNIKASIFETYGMTETLTHVAIKPLNGVDRSDYFRAVEDVRFEVDDRDCLIVNAPLLNPEPVITNDIVELLSDKTFRWLGRFDNVINSGGVKIYPEVIEAKLLPQLHGIRYFITGLPDDKLGQKVALVIEGKVEVSFDMLEKYEQPKEVLFIEHFDETESGKINRPSITAHLQ